MLVGSSDLMLSFSECDLALNSPSLTTPTTALREILPGEAGKFLPGELAECLTVDEVDDEVNTGVTHQRQVVQTSQTEEPVRGDKQVLAAPLHLLRHHHLVAVEDDPGDVTTAEHAHDAGDDEGAVDLTLHTQPTAAVRKSKSQSKSKFLPFPSPHLMPLCILQLRTTKLSSGNKQVNITLVQLM